MKSKTKSERMEVVITLLQECWDQIEGIKKDGDGLADLRLASIKIYEALVWSELYQKRIES